MDHWVFWLVVVFAAITIYRMLSARMTTPTARVTAMLRRYHALEKRGLSDKECLFQLLSTRRGWKNLPHSFLAELVSRLSTKEDVMRFVSVSEDSRYHRDHYPTIAAKADLEEAMTETACFFTRFGHQLQSSGRYREAEFVQRLALRLQPDRYFTNLPLAATYHETGRHADALPLFERGLAELAMLSMDAAQGVIPPEKCLGPDMDLRELRARYKKMHRACRRASAANPM
ncbi:MAG TPA: hypothetical protein VNO43_07870 [Candidatus Eisenbacteria bacterium]|nr:hypothetical protein [Candidatus Eisenbacteria bacterium]